MAHQIDAQFLLAGGLEQVREGNDARILLEQDMPELDQVFRIETPQRETFLAGVLMAKPVIGDRSEFREQRGHLLAFDNLKADAFAFELIQDIALRLMARPVGREGREGNMRLFANFDRH